MAAKSGAQRHTHKYFKTKNGIWACGLGNCTHLLPRNMEEMIFGRASLCWTCTDTMLIGDKQIKMDRPSCDKCILKAEGIGVENADAIINFLKQQERKPSDEPDIDEDDGRLY